MRIIKEGNLNKKKEMCRFRCKKCDCVFESAEFIFGSHGCPTCADRAYIVQVPMFGTITTIFEQPWPFNVLCDWFDKWTDKSIKEIRQ